MHPITQHVGGVVVLLHRLLDAAKSGFFVPRIEIDSLESFNAAAMNSEFARAHQRGDGLDSFQNFVIRIAYPQATIQPSSALNDAASGGTMI